MRKYLVFGLCLFVLLIITSCTKNVVCNKPYIQVGTDCCLDQNGNNICDNDDQSLEEKKLALESNPVEGTATKSVSKPTKEITADWCGYTEPIHFDCRYGFLWKDGIELKLRMIESGQYRLKKLIFEEVDCELELPNSPEYLLKFNDEVLFDVPCNISQDAVDINMVIIADYYTKDANPESSTPSEITLEEGIGGIVRNRNGPVDFNNPLVEGIVTSDCSFSSDLFKCTKHKIGENMIELRLKSLNRNKINIKKIDLSFVPCSIEFKGKEISWMEYGEEKTFIIPCEMKREFAKSPIEITYDEYPVKKDGSGNMVLGEYEEVSNEKLLTGGWVSGMVRDSV